MATNYWLGTTPAVAQVSRAQISSFDASTTYKVTIGGVTVSVTGSTSAAVTATNLVAALNASTHPYFSTITWAVDSTDYVKGTADTAGVPFTATSSVSGGTGTMGSFADVTACSGPNFWNVATNWSLGTVPADGEDVVLKDSDVSICWGLSNSSVDPASLQCYMSYTGRIGIDYQEFATSADGATTVSTAQEYRENYLILGTITLAELGKPTGAGSPSGSGRILLDSAFTTLRVLGTASSSYDTGRPAVRLKTTGSGDVDIYYAPGGVGIAAEEPGEVSTIDDLTLSDTGSSTALVLSSGVTMGDIVINGGTVTMGAAATVPVLTVNGGTVTLAGDYTITALTQTAGTIYDNHVKAAGNSVTTLNLQGGTYSLRKSSAARTLATVNQTGGTLQGDQTVTITTYNDPTVPYSIKVTT